MIIKIITLLLCTGCLSFATQKNAYGVGASTEPASETYTDDTQPGHTRDYFPKAGDFSIGFDGTPFLNYIGNAFNGTQNNSLNLGDNTLHFRYYITDDAAIRVAININYRREVDKFYLDDFADQHLDPLSRSQVEDKRVRLTNELGLRAGYLMFRGENRLRGFFGGDVFLNYENRQRMFEYGNQMNLLNPNPETVVNWNTGATANQNMRKLEENNGSNINLGIGAVMGAEYYLMPKVSIGVEMGVAYGHTFRTQANEKRETIAGSLHIEEDVEIKPGSSDEWNIKSIFPHTFGNLFLMISF